MPKQTKQTKQPTNFETMGTQTTMLNLIEKAKQISTTGKALHEQVKKTGKPVTLNVKYLLDRKKFPELECLPLDTAVFQVRPVADGYECNTLKAYTSMTGEATIYQTNLEPLSGFTFIAYKSGISGHCDIKHESGVELRIAISYSDEYVKEIVDKKSKVIEGEGAPLPHYLKQVPQPEIPLYSDQLPRDVELTVIATGLKSRKHQSPMVTATAINGEVFKNIICNAELLRIVEKHGLNAKFKIGSMREKPSKDDELIKNKGKVDKKKPAMIVQIIDLQGEDFSDL